MERSDLSPQGEGGQAKAEAKIEYYKTIEALQHRQDEAETKLQELKTAGDEAWEDLKTGAEKAWNEVKTAFPRCGLKVQMSMDAFFAVFRESGRNALKTRSP